MESISDIIANTDWKAVFAGLAVGLASLSFILTQISNRRSKKAQRITNLLGDKETVAFAALKLLDKGLPSKKKDRLIVISAILQACLFVRSDRARALLFNVIEKYRNSHKDEFVKRMTSIEENFDNMEEFKFDKKELDLSSGRLRINATKKVINNLKETKHR